MPKLQPRTTKTSSVSSDGASINKLQHYHHGLNLQKVNHICTSFARKFQSRLPSWLDFSTGNPIWTPFARITLINHFHDYHHGLIFQQSILYLNLHLICLKFRHSISSISIYYGTQSNIRVKTCCRLNLLRALVFNFERSDIL